MNESNPVLFYSKCRPQLCDAWPIARETKRVFIGYPVLRSDRPSDDWRKEGMGRIFADISSQQWDSIPKENASSQSTRNRNLITQIGINSVVLVPRPSSGKCHAGLIESAFEFVDKPDWIDEYLKLRKNVALNDEINHVGDMIQTWKVSKWEELPFAGIPRWITYRLLSRDTAGIICDLDDPKVSALDTIVSLMKKPANERYCPVNPREGLTRALLDYVSPASFEHLLVDLLQLEASDSSGDVFWHHVGGTGDGGVDGISVDNTGKLLAVLQCKWHWGGMPIDLVNSLRQQVGNAVKIIVAVLHGNHNSKDKMPDNARLIGRQELCDLVKRYNSRLPFAASIGYYGEE
jgi:hypothetical protein